MNSSRVEGIAVGVRLRVRVLNCLVLQLQYDRAGPAEHSDATLPTLSPPAYRGAALPRPAAGHVQGYPLLKAICSTGFATTGAWSIPRASS